MRFEPGGNLRNGRVTWLVLAEANEAAATGDLEGAAGAVDRVGDVHGRSLADSARRESGEGVSDECYRRPMTPLSTAPALELS